MEKIIKAIRFLDAGITHIEKVCLCAALALMLGVASLQVVLRNFLDSGLNWGDIFVRHMVLFLLFFGASLSTKSRRHIQMDISHKLVSAKVKPLVDMITSAVCIWVNLYLLKAAYVFAMDEKAAGAVLFGAVKSWYFIAIMPVGFALITFRFSLNLIESLVETGSRRTDLFDRPTTLK